MEEDPRTTVSGAWATRSCARTCGRHTGGMHVQFKRSAEVLFSSRAQSEHVSLRMCDSINTEHTHAPLATHWRPHAHVLRARLHLQLACKRGVLIQHRDSRQPRVRS